MKIFLCPFFYYSHIKKKENDNKFFNKKQNQRKQTIPNRRLVDLSCLKEKKSTPQTTERKKERDRAAR